MSVDHRVLAIDSNRAFLSNIQSVLGDKYFVEVVEDFEAFSEQFFSFKPDIVLVGNYLDEDSTVILYHELKKFEQDHHFEKLFFLEVDSLESRLLAYEAGASDVMPRVFQQFELVAKLRILSNFLNEKHGLVSQYEDAHLTTRGLMIEATQYGTIVQFYRELSCCTFLEQLSFTLFQSLSALDLHASLVIRDDENLYFDSSVGVVNPIERNVFEILKSEGRIYQFGKRMLLQDGHTAFLIKNLPEDPQRVGVLRDTLAVMSEGLEAKYLDIKRQNTLLQVVENIASSIEDIASRTDQFEESFKSLYRETMEELNSSFHFLDMTMDQENHFTDMFEKVFRSMLMAKKDMAHVKEDLEDLSKHLTSSDILLEPEREPPSASLSGGDVELF
ncbi:hypothetical protein [Thaumasiovibrio subtropicus]|uniref:hypothetical protein n=1 Tax=Thaumasiovibrio subtropicus TaxID=1891207 RepID=UPI000B36452D|nr:hypothetical protein [Thaumasiovibrio subtropicus]